MYLAQNLRYLRERNGETQKDISELLSVTGYGYSEMAVSSLESGECEPELQKVVLLANHFGVSIDDLLTKDMRPPKTMCARNLLLARRTEALDHALGFLASRAGTDQRACYRTLQDVFME